MINLIVLSLLSWSGPSNLVDSLRTETINGKLYVIHQVESKETLSSLSRRYNSDVVSILEANPKTAASLEVGQVLRIPYMSKVNRPANEKMVHKVTEKETLFSISRMYGVSVDELKEWNKLTSNSLSLGQELFIRRQNKESLRVTPPAQATGTHVVQPKETLFAISKKYDVSVDQIKKWNDLQGTELKVGSIVIVREPKTTAREVIAVTEVRQLPVIKEETTAKEPVTPVKEAVTPVKETTQLNRETIRISEGVQGADEVKESGLAELIEGTEGNRKYLGLHKTAKTGTILKVRNEMNNREVFVRIVGPLPETGINDKLVIKLSKSAYERLGAIDPRFRVEVTYYK